MTDFFFYVRWPCLQAAALLGVMWCLELRTPSTSLCLVTPRNESRLESPVSLSRFEGEPKVPSQAWDS